MIGVVGNVLQLIQSASAVIELVRDVYNSTSATSRDIEDVAKTYSTLRDLTAGLAGAGHGSQGNPAPHQENLRELAATCSDKCCQLVKLAEKLKATRQGKLKWIDTIRAVVIIYWFEPDVRKLEKEIQKVQCSMVLVISAITGYSPSHISSVPHQLTR